MVVRFVIFVAFCVFVVNSEHVRRKFCRNVDPSKCNIHEVKLEPCESGPGFCLLRRERPYKLSFDFTPGFEAQKLLLSLHSDIDNSGSFSHEIMSAHDPCDVQPCPLEKDMRTTYDVDFVFVKKTHGKFPLQMKLWNEENESEACCFTFNVKMIK